MNLFLLAKTKTCFQAFHLFDCYFEFFVISISILLLLLLMLKFWHWSIFFLSFDQLNWIWRRRKKEKTGLTFKLTIKRYLIRKIRRFRFVFKEKQDIVESKGHSNEIFLFCLQKNGWMQSLKKITNGSVIEFKAQIVWHIDKCQLETNLVREKICIKH